MDLFVGPACGYVHRDAVPQQLVGPQVGLIQRDARGICGGQQLLQGGGNVCVGIAPFAQVRTEQVALNAAVVRARMPVAKVVIAEAVEAAFVGEQGHHPLLGVALGTWLGGHERLPSDPDLNSIRLCGEFLGERVCPGNKFCMNLLQVGTGGFSAGFISECLVYVL
jgi:hypothetical protein